jgi:tRNA 2-selenouridine synthase
MDVKTRIPRLLEEYTTYPSEVLKLSILKISKRLGGENTREAVDAVDKGDFTSALEIVLHYYDKAYLYGLKKKDAKNVIYVEADSDNIETNALKILDVAGKINWDRISFTDS